jgi:uncharacterized membrane protein
MKASQTSSERASRVLVVDAVRGLAVLCMIQWHCADAWIGGSIREGDAFADLRIVGGFAAPLFLLLAGISSGLTFRPAALGANIRRALTIVVMGYALKLFGWAVDHAAIAERRNWAAIATQTTALGLAWAFLREGPTTRQRAIALSVAGACLVGTWVALDGATCSPDVVWRLDVLQGIGAALIVTLGVLALAHRTGRPALVLLVVGLSVSLATPSFMGADLSFVPARILDYVARTTSDPACGARFPLFPWAGYALVGAAIGTAIRTRPSQDAWAVPFTTRALPALVVALAIAWLVFEPTWTAQWILSYGEQPRNLMRLTFNTSIATAMAAASSLVLPRALRIADALLALGRHSLVVYAVHLEIAYGLPSIPINHQLSFASWALTTSALVALMIVLARALDVYAARSKARAVTRAAAAR